MNNNQADILKAFTILCVEDEIPVRDELASFLERRVKHLYVAGNGKEGLELFKTHLPDIVITDILMPVMNGLDMTKEIKSINPNVPVIVTTAFNNHDFFLRAIEMGVSKYVLKPLKIREFIKSINEVAWLLRAQRELRISSTVFNASAEAILITDENNVVISANPAFTLITGYEHHEIIGKHPNLLNSGRQDSAFYRAMWQSIKTKKRWEGEIWNRRKNGAIYPEWLTITAVIDESGETTYHVAIFSDLTIRKNAEQQVYHLAHYDPLTNLPNRTLLQDRLTQAIGHAARSNSLIAILFIDLDRFKFVNDSFGHVIGDLLLQEVGSRLKASVRTSDTIARLGADEFVMLLPQVANLECVTQITQNLLKRLTDTFILQDYEIHIGTSIGIAMYPDNGVNAESLLRTAESAMFAVKEGGRNSFQFFRNDINDRLQEKLAIENNFVAALNQNQFEVFYQPIFDENHSIVRVEALLHWNKPNSTDNSEDFWTLAEETGVSWQLGRWLFRTALSEIKQLQTEIEAHQNLKVEIKVTAKQLEAPDFSDYLSQLIRELQFNPRCLELEISEQILMQESEARAYTLNHLRGLGIFLVVDNFSLSYSALLQLSSLPIARVKIGSEFIENEAVQGRDAFTTMSAIMGMANSLSLKVTFNDINPAHLVCANSETEIQDITLSSPLSLLELKTELKSMSKVFQAKIQSASNDIESFVSTSI